jgi:hypothetical protein
MFQVSFSEFVSPPAVRTINERWARRVALMDRAEYTVRQEILDEKAHWEDPGVDGFESCFIRISVET